MAVLPAWSVTHLHGARTGGGNDGWTENAALRGESQLSEYPNDQAATALWYHDHAMGITRLNVQAGLAGMYLLRDEEEEALGLPAGPYEIPLVLCDRNLALGPEGEFTGRLLHKTAGPLPFFGPYTLVNGVIWPYLEVRARWYRFRVLNASNARTYRLHLVDEQGDRVPDALWQIGTDSGLLGAPIPLPDGGLALMPAERADLLLDFGALTGRTLRLVNSALGQLVRIAGRFGGATGRYMYHCHLLEHEDDGMMRPFTVSPGAVLDLQNGMPMPDTHTGM